VKPTTCWFRTAAMPFLYPDHESLPTKKECPDPRECTLMPTPSNSAQEDDSLRAVIYPGKRKLLYQRQ